MKNKLIVKTDVGTFTRTTARDYQFIVVSRGLSPAHIDRHAAKTLAYNHKLLAEYQDVVDGKRPVDPFLTRDHYVGYVKNVQEDIDTHEVTIAARHQSEAARPYFVHGWSSRLDLAGKVADNARNYYLDVRIYSTDGRKI